MNKRKRSKAAAWLLAVAFMLGSAIPAWAAEPTAPGIVKTDMQIATDLGVLQGDGSGVTAAYLAKTTTRMQAAILFLRLKGLEAVASAFGGTDNFSDAGTVSDGNKAILAYLKANPQLGWTGTGSGKFEPAAQVTAQQYYKVLLEALGYKQDADFTYDQTLNYARGLGLSQAAGAGSLRNAHVAAATVEALKARMKSGGKTLLDSLAGQKVIDAAKAAAAQYASIRIATDAALGSYLVDEAGKTLYMFMKDTPGISTCKDQCAVNWPVYYAENIQIPADLNAADFKTIVRDDGKKQTTYQGWPLYYYAKDGKAGDTLGQGVNQVWMVMNHSGVTIASLEGLGSYIADSKGMALYLYTKDSANLSVCKGNCEVNWPIFYTEHLPVMGQLKSTDFATITREDGTKQTTYQGWPLYYYVKDTKPGEVKGQDVGKVWYVIDPTAAAKPVVKAEPKTYSIEIAKFAFSVQELTVEAGSTITFTNNDPVMHNAVSDLLKEDGTPFFETKLLGKGESESVTIDKPGVYTYYCLPHKANMKATIIVK
ncbi:plastocyanin/azurin family copper-binding protein [Paenibacillus piri]|nr:plastocyanin/azurin family copper-binding protein [Paenibacillus piri]